VVCDGFYFRVCLEYLSYAIKRMLCMREQPPTKSRCSLASTRPRVRAVPLLAASHGPYASNELSLTSNKKLGEDLLRLPTQKPWKIPPNPPIVRDNMFIRSSCEFILVKETYRQILCNKTNICCVCESSRPPRAGAASLQRDLVCV
jgi:hypothetical protein